MSDKLEKRKNPKELSKGDIALSGAAGIGFWVLVPWIGGPVTGLMVGAGVLGWRWVKRKTS